MTYEADDRNNNEIKDNFNEQSRLLNPFVDFYYFDVLSSINEFQCGIDAIKEFKKPNLIGMHISEGSKLPSGEKISEIKNILDDNVLGAMLSCVSPENYEKSFDEMKNLNIPFGFKFNAFQTTKPNGGYTQNYAKNNVNPNEFLGHRTDLNPKKIAEFAKKFKEGGATILGGCCEIRPSHIKELSKLK